MTHGNSQHSLLTTYGYGIVLDGVDERAIGRQILGESARGRRGRVTSSRGNSGSFGVKTLKTDCRCVRNRPLGVVLLKISAKNRGLGVFSESQQGMRNATGRLFGTSASRSTQRS